MSKSDDPRASRGVTQRSYTGDPDDWTIDDPEVGPSVPKNVRRGGATKPHLKRELGGNGTAYEGHAVSFECTNCGNVQRFVTSEFMTMYSCRECSETERDVRWFEFKWDLNR